MDQTSHHEAGQNPTPTSAGTDNTEVENSKQQLPNIWIRDCFMTYTDFQEDQQLCALVMQRAAMTK